MSIRANTYANKRDYNAEDTLAVQRRNSDVSWRCAFVLNLFFSEKFCTKKNDMRPSKRNHFSRAL